MEEVLNFINEKLPVIISYALILMGYIYQIFIKFKIKKNYNLFHDIVKNEAHSNEVRSKQLVGSAVDELKKAQEALLKEKKRLEKDYNELKNQLTAVTQACQLLVANSEDLVKNGTASQVLKIIPVNDIQELKEAFKNTQNENIKIEEKEIITNGNNISNK